MKFRKILISLIEGCKYLCISKNLFHIWYNIGSSHNCREHTACFESHFFCFIQGFRIFRNPSTCLNSHGSILSKMRSTDSNSGIEIPIGSKYPYFATIISARNRFILRDEMYRTFYRSSRKSWSMKCFS